MDAKELQTNLEDYLENSVVVGSAIGNVIAAKKKDGFLQTWVKNFVSNLDNKDIGFVAIANLALDELVKEYHKTQENL